LFFCRGTCRSDQVRTHAKFNEPHTTRIACENCVCPKKETSFSGKGPCDGAFVLLCAGFCPCRGWYFLFLRALGNPARPEDRPSGIPSSFPLLQAPPQLSTPNQNQTSAQTPRHTALGPAKTKHRPRTRGVATGIISSVTVTCQSSFGALARPSHTHTLTLFLFAQDLLLLALFIFFLLTIAKFSFCLSQSHSSPSAGPFLTFLLSTSRAGLDLRPCSFFSARQSRH